jgi:hypothetical protein
MLLIPASAVLNDEPLCSNLIGTFNLLLSLIPLSPSNIPRSCFRPFAGIAIETHTAQMSVVPSTLHDSRGEVPSVITYYHSTLLAVVWQLYCDSTDLMTHTKASESQQIGREFELVGVRGIKPLTPRSRNECSITELHPDKLVSERGFEPRTHRPKRWMLPLHYSEESNSDREI